MSTRIRTAIVAAALLGSTQGAFAQTTGLTPGRVMIWASIGFQADLGGSLNSSGVGLVQGLRAEINANTWGERYDASLLVRVGGGYNINDRLQVFLGTHWEQGEADDALVGLLGGQTLNAKFTDYQGWGLDVGARYVFPTTSRAKPFVSGSIGFQRIDDISATFTSFANAFQVTNVPFYDDSWVGQWRLGGGVLVDLTPHFGIQATLELKYSGVLSDQAGLGTLGFERVNDTGNRWTLPYMAGVYVKF